MNTTTREEARRLGPDELEEWDATDALTYLVTRWRAIQAAMRCNRCHRPMAGTTAYDGACACGGLIEKIVVGDSVVFDSMGVEVNDNVQG